MEPEILTALHIPSLSAQIAASVTAAIQPQFDRETAQLDAIAATLVQIGLIPSSLAAIVASDVTVSLQPQLDQHATQLSLIVNALKQVMVKLDEIIEILSPPTEPVRFRIDLRLN